MGLLSAALSGKGGGVQQVAPMSVRGGYGGMTGPLPEPLHDRQNIFDFLLKGIGNDRTVQRGKIPPFIAPGMDAVPQYDPRTRELLAKTLQAEAGGEGYEGLLAAGAVIDNRRRLGRFGGKDWEGVIMKPGQFSAWNKVTGYAGGQGGLDMGRVKPTKLTYAVVDQILSGQYDDPTGGATHYYNPSVANPAWGAKRAGGDWYKIGNHIFGRADAGASGGGSVRQALQPPRPTIPTGGPAMANAPVDPGILGALIPGMAPREDHRWWTPERRDRLVMALEGMTLNPNQALIADTAARMTNRRDMKKTGQQRNATADWLEANGQPELAAGVRSGAVPASAALAMYKQGKTQQQNQSGVQSSQMLPDGSWVYMTREGMPIVKKPDGTTVTGMEAAEHIRAAQEYGVQLERDKYGSRETGKLEAQAELGAEAEGAKKAGAQAQTIAANTFKEIGPLSSKLRNIDRAISAIDGGAKAGMIYKNYPDVTVASAELTNAMNSLGLDVIGSVTFGALSAAELKIAMETAVPRNLDAPELREWLVARRNAQWKLYDYAMQQAQYLSKPDTTLSGWLDYIQENKMGPAGMSPSAPELPQVDVPVASGAKRLRYNAETGQLEPVE